MIEVLNLRQLDRKNDLPRIGVCILTYNSEKTIEYVLDSLLKQEYPSDLVHYLVIDGGSTDNTIDIVQSKFNSITSIRYKILIFKGSNIPQARNKCIEEILKEDIDIVIFVDSDVIITATNALESISRLCVKKNSLIYFASSPKYFRDVESFHKFYSSLNFSKIVVDEIDLKPVVNLGMGFTAIPKQLAVTNKFDEELDFNEDTFYVYTVLKKGSASYVVDKVKTNIFDINIDHKSDIYWRISLKKYLRASRKKTICRVINFFSIERNELKLHSSRIVKILFKHVANSILLLSSFMFVFLYFVRIELALAVGLIRLFTLLSYSLFKYLHHYPLIKSFIARIKFEISSLFTLIYIIPSYIEVRKTLENLKNLI